MTLREALLRWERLAPTLLAPPTLGERKLSATAIDLAGRSGGIARAPSLETVEELVARLRAAVDAGKFDDVSQRDWSRAAFALWHGERPLAADGRFLGAYLARLRLRQRRRDVSLLIAAYLHAFSPALPGLQRVADVLHQLSRNWPWAWADRGRQLHLFEPTRAPTALFDACLANDDPHTVQAQLGLEHLIGEGLVLAAQQHGIRQLERDLNAGGYLPDKLHRMLRWSVGPDGVPPRLRGPLADALLRPWIDRPAPDPLKQQMQDSLLKHYGDPRMRPQRWASVSEQARQVFRKWLARVALAQFLEVIDRMAYDRQWKYRRAFWTAYFDRDSVWDAQVAFGPGGAALGRQLFGQDTPFALLESGTKQVEHGHAVLLMRLGELTIADWSHNGQCVIWSPKNRSRPSLQQYRYSSSDVDRSTTQHRWVHVGAASYTWQRRVRDFIAQETGLRLNDRDFQVS